MPEPNTSKTAFNSAASTNAVRDTAMQQARELGNESPAVMHTLELFIKYQGEKWYDTHKKTAALIKDGDFEGAIAEVAKGTHGPNKNQSKWSIDHPEEVKAVQNALRAIENTHPSQNNDADLNQELETYDRFIDHLMKREGWENKVYLDTMGKPTVGVGHLVLGADDLEPGDVISDEQVLEFLKVDAQKAFDNAAEKMEELGIKDNPDFHVALGSVNFQLGTEWHRDIYNDEGERIKKGHTETWRLMKEGKFAEAANEAERGNGPDGKSLWFRQTPTRVEDFQKALRTLDAELKAAPAQEQQAQPQPPAPTMLVP